MSSLIPFSFESSEIRFIPEGQSFSVVAKDIAESLGYAWAGIATISHVPKEWRGVNSVQTPRGIQEMLVLTEQGMYFFLNRSDKPKALPLQKWVAGEVLPSIRQTGGYALPHAQPQPTPSSAPLLAAQLVDLLQGKVLVDGTDLQEILQDLYVLRNIFERIDPLARRIEVQYGHDIVGDLRPAPTTASATHPTRIPARLLTRFQTLSSEDGKLSAYQKALDFITAEKGKGARGSDLISGCRAYRGLEEGKREALIKQLLDDGAVVEIQPESKPGARRKALVYVAKSYAERIKP